MCKNERQTLGCLYLNKIFSLFCKRTEYGGAPLINVHEFSSLTNGESTTNKLLQPIRESKVNRDGPKNHFKERIPREAGSRLRQKETLRRRTNV